MVAPRGRPLLKDAPRHRGPDAECSPSGVQESWAQRIDEGAPPVSTRRPGPPVRGPRGSPGRGSWPWLRPKLTGGGGTIHNLGPGPDRAFSATTIETIDHRVSGIALDSDGHLFYVAALFVLVAGIFAPADDLYRDFDGAFPAALAVPTSVVGFLTRLGLIHYSFAFGLVLLALLLFLTTALALFVDHGLTFSFQLIGVAQ